MVVTQILPLLVAGETNLSFVIAVAKWIVPKVGRIPRQVVLIFALGVFPTSLSMRRWSHRIFNLRSFL